MFTIEYLRSFRIEGYALFDLSLAILAIYLAAPWLSKLTRKCGIEVPKHSWLLLTLPISISIHVLVGTYTPMTKNFLDPSDHYLLKLLILVFLVLGLKDMKWVKATKHPKKQPHA